MKGFTIGIIGLGWFAINIILGSSLEHHSLGITCEQAIYGIGALEGFAATLWGICKL